MPDALQTTPAFTIQEVNGQRRRLRFTQRCLPFRPIEFTSAQRVVVDYYPGNPQGTSTVMGGEQEPTTFSGEWNEKFLQGRGSGDASPASIGGRAIETTEELVRIVDSFRAAGALMEVRWFMEVRRGHLRRFKRRWKNVNDVEWDLEFVWVSAADVPAQAPVRVPATVQDTEEELSRGLDTTAAKVQEPPEPFIPSVLERISDVLSNVESSVSQLQGAVDTATRQALGPYDATRRALGVLTGLAGQTRELLGEVTDQPAAYLFSVIGEPPGVEFTPGRRVSAEVYARSLQGDTRKMNRAASIARANLLRSLQSDLLAVYVARDGDDLRDVSETYYGTPGEWRRLLLFNHLQSAELVRGQVVFVPRRGQGEAGASEA